MHYRTAAELDEEILAKYAAKALGWEGPTWLDGPENRIGSPTTGPEFGVVFGYPRSADDLLAVSNYSVIAESARAAAGDNADRDVRDNSLGHWAFGDLYTLEVRVYEPGYEPGRWDNVDEHPTDVEDVRYTAAFCEAVSLLLALQDCAVLDESDYNAREDEAREAAFDDAVRMACGLDNAETQKQVRIVMWELLTEETDGDPYSIICGDGWRAEDVNYDAIREWYHKGREEMYARRDAAYWGDPVYLHREARQAAE